MDPVSPVPPISTPAAPVLELKNKIWVWVLAGVSLLGVGIVAGVFLGKHLYSKPLPQPTPSPVVSVTPSPDPTASQAPNGDLANWKTYSSKIYSLSFQYPPQWTVDETDRIVDIYDTDKNNKKMRIVITNQTIQETQDQFIARRHDTDTEVRKNHLKTVLFSYPAVTYEEMSPPLDVFNLVTAILAPRYTYEMFYLDTDGTISQILSTFKFSTSQIDESCPLGLSPLKNDFFSICYPNTMSLKETIYTPTDRQTQAVMTRFENPDERIAVTTAFLGGWGGGYSLSKTTVADYPTEILTFKNTEGKIVNLVAVIDNGVSRGQFPIAIDYQQKSEAHFLDQEVFNNVINSFRLK